MGGPPDEKPGYCSVVEALNNNYYGFHVERKPGVEGISTEYMPPLVPHIIGKIKPMIKGQSKGRASEKTITNCSFTLGIGVVSAWPEIESLAALREKHGALGDLGTAQDIFTGQFIRDFKWEGLSRNKKYNFETDENPKKILAKVVMDTGSIQGVISVIAVLAQWQRESFIADSNKAEIGRIIASFRDYIGWKVEAGEAMIYAIVKTRQKAAAG